MRSHMKLSWHLFVVSNPYENPVVLTSHTPNQADLNRDGARMLLT